MGAKLKLFSLEFDSFCFPNEMQTAMNGLFRPIGIDTIMKKIRLQKNVSHI
jgi:hypothetical protein